MGCSAPFYIECCSSTTSFHFVPTLERTTREGTPPGKSSPFVRQRGILCGYFIVILHSTLNRRETFVVSFAPSRLRHPLPPMKSKALTSKFRDQAVFVRAVVIVVLTAQLLQPDHQGSTGYTLTANEQTTERLRTFLAGH
jgi:hypothetical protein